MRQLWIQIQERECVLGNPPIGAPRVIRLIPSESEVGLQAANVEEAIRDLYEEVIAS